MAKMIKKPKGPKGPVVKGKRYVGDDEIFDKRRTIKEHKGMRTPGIAIELELSESEQGYSKKPRVKPQKKLNKITHGQKRIVE
jgi:hypothetical protein